MTRPISLVSLMALSGTLLFAMGGCGGVDDDGSGITDPDGVASSNGDSATDATALRWGVWQRRVATRTRAPVATSTSSTPPAGPNTSGSSSTGSSASSLDADAVAAAARTPDGAAIPQPAGPNGQCPDVLAVFGFWSCPNLNEQCSFGSAGTTTSCTCLPSSGEGQFPSWVCGQ